MNRIELFLPAAEWVYQDDSRCSEWYGDGDNCVFQEMESAVEHAYTIARSEMHGVPIVYTHEADSVVGNYLCLETGQVHPYQHRCPSYRNQKAACLYIRIDRLYLSVDTTYDPSDKNQTLKVPHGTGVVDSGLLVEQILLPTP